MRTIVLLVALLAIPSLTILGQKVKKCDETVLKTTSDKVGLLSQNEIRDFLLTFGKACQNNTEYSEWSNELLFTVINKQTKLTLQTIEKEAKRLEFEEILDELSSPINDSIDVKALISKIHQVRIDGRLKKQVLDKLQIAEPKLH